MCGVAVAIGWPEAEAVVRQLICGILHRGDITDPIVVPRANTAMCTRRLRIIDGDRAVQPQASFDGRLLVSFNGEIYNYRELRAELAGLGIPFKTESDTEVLANALQAWGHKALLRLVGMYAFVAIDVASGTFLAARDPFGVKPLYVIQNGTGFVFCSEIQPLLDTIETGDVLLLPPGYLLTDNVCAKYHSAIVPPAPSPAAGDPRALDMLLSEAIRIRVPHDQKCGIFFSGGIDSTLVAHYARRFSREVAGYCLGDEEAADYPYAAHFADKTGFDLRLVAFDAESDDTFALLGDVVDCIESFEPGEVRGAVCSHIVAKRMHDDGYRIALCGDGADELFCGYSVLEQAFSESFARGCQIRDECLALMHRTCLQRVDRCFLDPSVAGYALALDVRTLIGGPPGALKGKAALRDLCDLAPSELPRMIRDRAKIPFGEGAGLNPGGTHSSWNARFESATSDRAFRDGQREFSAFDVASREELFYLRRLSQTMDVFRVPHLRDRVRVTVPAPSSSIAIRP
jgi:asparagine synthase (glutamine-hydrolysing)